MKNRILLFFLLLVLIPGCAVRLPSIPSIPKLPKLRLPKIFDRIPFIPDPWISGYVIDGATVHTVAGFKFHGSGNFIPINYNGYGPTSFEGFKSWLFVANYRDGKWSEVGARSGHWQGNVMHVRENYSDKLQAFLRNPPKHFHLLWEKDGIKLFEIADSTGVKE